MFKSNGEKRPIFSPYPPLQNNLGLPKQDQNTKQADDRVRYGQTPGVGRTSFGNIGAAFIDRSLRSIRGDLHPLGGSLRLSVLRVGAAIWQSGT